MSAAAAPLTANPSLLVLPAVAVLALAGGLIAFLPIALLLASLVGALGVQPTMALNLLAFPALAVGVFFIVVMLAIVADLRLPRPVLRIDADGVFDRRVTDTPIRWSDIEDVGLAPGGGAMQLKLRAPRDTRVSPWRGGTLGIRAADPAVALIPLHAMDRPARELAEAILAFARRHGAVAEAEAQ